MGQEKRLNYVVSTNWDELSQILWEEYQKGKTIFLELEDILTDEFNQMLNGDINIPQYFEIIQKELNFHYRESTLASKKAMAERLKVAHKQGRKFVRIVNRPLFEGSLQENDVKEVEALRAHHDKSNPEYYSKFANSGCFDEIVSYGLAYAISSAAYFRKRNGQDIDWVITNIENFEGPLVYESARSWVSFFDRLRGALSPDYKVTMKVIEQIAIEGDGCDPSSHVFAPQVRLKQGLVAESLTFVQMKKLAAQEVIYSMIVNRSKPEQYSGQFPKSYMSSVTTKLLELYTFDNLKELFNPLKTMKDASFENKIHFVKGY